MQTEVEKAIAALTLWKTTTKLHLSFVCALDCDFKLLSLYPPRIDYAFHVRMIRFAHHLHETLRLH